MSKLTPYIRARKTLTRKIHNGNVLPEKEAIMSRYKVYRKTQEKRKTDKSLIKWVDDSSVIEEMTDLKMIELAIRVLYRDIHELLNP